tara:strand:+ start:166 stop:504 length:339 start_codon:yes stop_codon:yes gene_type:complete
MGKFIDLTGKTYGKLTVIRRADNANKTTPMWECLCECSDNITIVNGGSLRRGATRSCGCSKGFYNPRLISLADVRYINSKYYALNNQGGTISEHKYMSDAQCSRKLYLAELN